MAPSSLEDPHFEELRRLARQADWSGVRELGARLCLSHRPEAELLVAEAELRQGDLAGAKVRLQRVTAAAERIRDGATHRRSTNMLGAAYFELGELEDAERLFDWSLAEASRADDHLTGARATNNLGLIANVRGRHDLALGYYRLALPAYQRLGFASGLGETTHNIAITLRDLGQLEDAEREERRAIQFGTDAGNARLSAMARAGRADVLLLTGEAVVARAEAARAAREFAAVGDPVGEADALRILGRAHQALGSMDASAPSLIRAIELAARHGAVLIEAEARWAAAELALAAGDRDRAAAEVATARARFEQAGASRDLERLESWWARIIGPDRSPGSH